MKKRHDLARFGRRVRLLRAWRGLALGGFAGAVACLGWGTLDWFRILYASWAGLGVLLGTCALAGGFVGLFWPVRADSLADSVDRRGGLQDRLRTTMERDGSGGMDSALAADASAHLEVLRPAALYPVRPSRWHLAMVVTAVVASAIFLLGSGPLLLSDQQKKDREALKTAGKTVERVRKDFEAAKPGTKAEKDLAAELKKFQQELERARLDKPEALQKANELAKKADELTREQAQKNEQALRTAATAAEKMEKAERDNNQSKALEKDLAQAQKEGQQLSKQMSDLKEKLANSKLSPSEMQQLQAKQSELSKAMQQNKGLQMELSQKIKDLIERIHSDSLYKELQKLAEKLAQNAKSTQQTGQPSLTKEQIEEMKKKLEELADRLKDDKALKEYMEALKQAMEDALKNGATASMAPCLMGGFGLFSLPGAGGPSQDVWTGDTGHINKLDKPVPGQGKTQTLGVTGDRQDKGDETYIEIRGPASLGARSRVPYQQVLPSYRRRAEQAINRQKIPPDQQKRVKQYFESLSGQ